MVATATKIEKLTQGQENELVAFRNEYLQIGRSVEPADKDRAQRAITQMYREIGEEPPRFLWFSSPMACLLAMAILKTADQLPEGQLWGQLWDQLRGQLRDQLSDQLSDQLGGQLWDQLRGQLWDQLSDQLWDQLGDQLRGQLWDQLWDQLRGQLGGQLRDQLWDQLRDQLSDQLSDQLWDQLGDQLWDQLRGQLWGQLQNSHLWGQHDAYWIAYYAFPERHLGIRYPEQASSRLALWYEVAKSCGWWWPLKGLVIVSDRPDLMSLDERGRLHSETGPAMRFRDTYGIWAHHGVRLRREIIEDPAYITLKVITEEQNAEIKRVMIQRYGQERYLKDSKAELIHEDDWGKLWKVERGDDSPMLFVEVINSTPEPDGSFKTYYLRVDPRLRPMLPQGGFGEPQKLTARNAVASSFGLRGEDYNPAFQS